MQQYFIDEQVETGRFITFNEEQSHHMLHVVRMKQDDIVRISDKLHRLFYARLDISKKTVRAQVLEEIEDHTRTAVEITLIQGLIKGEKWDYLIQKACELGVTRIVPLTTQRSVVRIAADKIDKKLVRWNKIALEACEQCRRSTPVEIVRPIMLDEVIDYCSDVNLIAYEDADAASERLYQVLKEYTDAKSITVVIGSEGGFTPEEVAKLKDHGFMCVSLGYRILRAETAALSVLNTIDFYYDMIGDKND